MGFGDYIMLTAFAKNACQDNKKVSFYYLTSKIKKIKKKNYAKIEILHNNPYITEILIESRFRFFLRRLWRFLKGEKDYVYFPLHRFTQAYMVPSPKEKYRFELKNKDLHAVEAFCQKAGIKANTVKPEVILTETEKSKVDDIMKNNNIIPNSYVIIETSTLLENSTKQWPVKHWEKLLKMIHDRFPDLKIVQISPNQKHFENVTDISGKTSFRESLRFVEQAQAVITTEGALMHSAAIYNIPCVAIISSCMSPKVTAYPGQTRLFYDKKLECSECGFFAECPNNNICMTGISPEKVFQTFCKIKDEIS
jgi:ADP-heptose:LPS heptosyltransferase